MERYFKCFLFTLIAISISTLAFANHTYKIIGIGEACHNCWTEPTDINAFSEVVGITQAENGHQYLFHWAEEQGLIDIMLGSPYEAGYDVKINDNGQVAGTTLDGEVFIWTKQSGVINLGKLFEPTDFINLLDFNNMGQAVGQAAINLSGDEHGFISSIENGMTDLGTLYDSPRSEAHGINKLGQVVGHSDTNIMAPYGVVYQHAFLWTADEGMIDLGTLGGDSFARDINDIGQVVGHSKTESGIMHGFLWTEDDGMIDLGVLPEMWSISDVSKITNSGKVIGRWYTENREQLRSFFWENGEMVDLGTLGSQPHNTSTTALNEIGQVVGNSNGHAFMWQNDQIIDLNDLLPSDSEWELQSARDINNFGQIIGYGNLYGVRHGFIITPPAIVIIENTVDFFDQSVEAGTIVGDGQGNSANGRLNALRNMLEMAGDLINIGDIEGACGQLHAALRKCDGDSPPPDFVTGSAVSELYNMIVKLMEELGCE